MPRAWPPVIAEIPEVADSVGHSAGRDRVPACPFGEDPVPPLEGREIVVATDGFPRERR
ncbi:hypothetical protein ABZ990_17490 [Streptomyces sp. NPDC046203]|uniref:hypothetical protein n=1 Tax=Streptomyces sp. NPDC046203 TaxID=3154602 RepID=UPI0033D50CCE